jgi:hypothetical protein
MRKERNKQRRRRRRRNVSKIKLMKFEMDKISSAY